MIESLATRAPWSYEMQFKTIGSRGSPHLLVLFGMLFKFEVVDKRVTVARRQLRFLPRTIFRFGEKTDDVFDGAIFAYVATSNDPAAMVILEAVRTENESRWQYGIPRSWSFAAKATFDDKTVWEVEDAYPFKDPQSSFYLNAIPNKGK
jgi:hypothetical protein